MTRRVTRGRDSTFARYFFVGRHLVPGWLSRDAVLLIETLARFQDERLTTGGFCEIGVHHGRSLILLELLARDTDTVLAVDVFEDQHLNVDHSGSGEQRAFTRNVRRFARDPARVVVLKADSTTLSWEEVVSLAHSPIRLFSIDGGHTSDVTYNDLRIAEPSLAPGGMVILDDVFNEAFPAVSEGLVRYLSQKSSRLVPALVLGNKMILCEPEKLSALQVVVSERLERKGLVCQHHNYFGHELLAVRRRPKVDRPAFWFGYIRGWAGARVRAGR